MSAIFLSHSSSDSAIAQELCTWLEARGHRSLFLDFDPDHGIPAGRNWEQELYRQLRACQAVIVLCSEDSMRSDWCFVEITHARALGKHIFPLRIAPCTVRATIADLQIIDATGSRADAYDRLLNGLHAAGLDKLEDWDATRAPYPGLMAFQEADAAVFFGREADIAGGLDALTRMSRFGGARHLVFLGASGSGKSSLVRAGVLPRLKRDAGAWLVVPPFRPLQRPLDEMASALAEAFKTSAVTRDWKQLREELERAADAADAGAALGRLFRDLRTAAGNRDAIVLLTIDQFEESLTMAPEATRFHALLRVLLEAPDAGAIVVSTLRSDFLGAFQKHPALEAVPFDTVSLGALGLDGYVQVIEGPARVAALALEAGLTQLIIADTGSEDGLPLLAFTLRELWEQDGRTGTLSIATYRDKLGGVYGSVARAAEAVLAHEPLTPAQEDDLRAAFLAMARLNEAGQFTRQAARWSDLPEGVHPLLERFVNARLLVSSSEKQERIVEVAHEALFRVWKRLEAWLGEDRENLRLRESVRQGAREWNERGRVPELLVHRGSRLEAAETLVRQRRFALDPEQREYLAACIGAREAEREAERQRALARRRRLQYTIAGLALGLVVVSALGVWAGIERQQAQRRLASLHWVNGVTERDRNDDPLKAVHHFMQAAALADDAADARNAFFAGEMLTGRAQLAGVLEPGNAILAATPVSGGVVTWTGDGAAQMWTAENGAPRALAPPAARLRKVTASAGGTRVVLSDSEGGMQVRDSRSGQLLASLDAAAEMPVFSADEARFAILDKNGVVHVWDSSARAPLAALEHRGAVRGMALGRKGDRIVTWDDQRTMRLWDVDRSASVAELPLGSDAVGAVISGDGSRVFVWSREDPAALWDAGHGNAITALPLGARGNSKIVGATFFDNDRRILSWNYGGMGAAQVWDAATGKELARFDHRDAIAEAVLDRAERLLLTASDDGTARVSSLDGAQLLELRHKAKVRGAAFSTDETRILTWSDDRSARMWDARTGMPLSVPLLHEGAVEGATIGDDGRSIVTWDQRSARIWQERNDIEPRVRTLQHAHTVLSAAFAQPDGEMVTLTDEGALHRWRRDKEQPPAFSLSPRIGGGAFDAEGQRLVAWSTDHSVGVWNAANGLPVTPPMRHDASAFGILGATISHDGRRVLSWGDDKTARVWGCRQRQGARGAAAHDDRNRRPVQSGRSPHPQLERRPRGAPLGWRDPQIASRVAGERRGRAGCAADARQHPDPDVGRQRHAAFLEGRRWCAPRRIPPPERQRRARRDLEPRRAPRAVMGRRRHRSPVGAHGRQRPVAPVVWYAEQVAGAAFNADDTRIVTRADDGVVRLWESRNGQPLTIPLHQRAEAAGVSLSTDGVHVLAWGGLEAQSWNVAVDYGGMGKAATVRQEVLTGTRLDPVGQLQVMGAEEWKKARAQIVGH